MLSWFFFLFYELRGDGPEGWEESSAIQHEHICFTAAGLTGGDKIRGVLRYLEKGHIKGL